MTKDREDHEELFNTKSDALSIVNRVYAERIEAKPALLELLNKAHDKVKLAMDAWHIEGILESGYELTISSKYQTIGIAIHAYKYGLLALALYITDKGFSPAFATAVLNKADMDYVLGGGNGNVCKTCVHAAKLLHNDTNVCTLGLRLVDNSIELDHGCASWSDESLTAEINSVSV